MRTWKYLRLEMQLISGTGEHTATVAAEGQPGFWRPLLRHTRLRQMHRSVFYQSNFRYNK